MTIRANGHLGADRTGDPSPWLATLARGICKGPGWAVLMIIIFVQEAVNGVQMCWDRWHPPRRRTMIGSQ